jgi:hypothetical protein
MADEAPRGPRLSRETRLLIVTISISALVLLLLAQLRFPQAPIVVPVAQPLDRLAARAPYDLLASSIARLEEAIAPSLIVLRVAPRNEWAPRYVADLLAPPETAADTVRHLPALRISPTNAVAAIGPDVRIAGIIGAADPSATAGIVAADSVRRLALIRVPDAMSSVTSILPLSDLRPPLYVVAVEGTHAGVTMRPVFLGRGDRFSRLRWTRPLLPLGGVPVTPGALMFTFEGQFLGVVVVEDGAQVIAAGGDVIETVERLSAAPHADPGDAGIAVQPLTSELAAATRAVGGVVVSEVDPGGAAAGVLQPGDVVTAINGEVVTAPDGLLLQIATRRPGDDLLLTIVRDGVVRGVTLTLGAAHTAAPPEDDEPIVMRPEPGAGTVVVRAAAGSLFDRAGLRAGDVIVRVGDVDRPSPAQVRVTIDRTPPDGFVLLLVRRDGRQRVLAVQIPPEPDVAPR